MSIQVIFNVFISFSYYLLIAISFSLVYSITRFFHFAHAVVFTGGAYFTFLFKVWLGLPLGLAVVLAIVCSALLGCLMDVGVYRHLRKKQASSMILLLASLGMYIVLQNLISMVFGDDTKTIRSWAVKEGLNVFGARITPVQILIIVTSIVLVVLVALFLKKSKMGKAMRAVANDPELANISGINSNRVILWTFAIGSALAGIAGILVSLDVDMTPTMGMNALMMGVVAMIIGGVGSIPGVALGALLLGFAQHFGVWKISSQWQDAIAFIILFVFLMFKPEGFLGRKKKLKS
ncbi:MAG: branched-chain amino acid ABC transporter permease [Candidatus Aminicenantes bacterium]|nr:branched-chain amino acid ABC transporter permease [Candidatus Aminicenantes bacterium]